MSNRIRTLMINIPNLPTMLAFRIIRRAVRRDPGYAEGWQANIAMSIYDESRRLETAIQSTISRTERGDFDSILTVPRDVAVAGMRKQHGELDGTFCNRAASRFMRTCFGVETSV